MDWVVRTQLEVIRKMTPNRRGWVEDAAVDAVLKAEYDVLKMGGGGVVGGCHRLQLARCISGLDRELEENVAVSDAVCVAIVLGMVCDRRWCLVCLRTSGCLIWPARRRGADHLSEWIGLAVMPKT